MHFMSVCFYLYIKCPSTSFLSSWTVLVWDNSVWRFGLSASLRRKMHFLLFSVGLTPVSCTGRLSLARYADFITSVWGEKNRNMSFWLKSRMLLCCLRLYNIVLMKEEGADTVSSGESEALWVWGANLQKNSSSSSSSDNGSGSVAVVLSGGSNHHPSPPEPSSSSSSSSLCFSPDSSNTIGT